MPQIKDTLDHRGTQYGSFFTQAIITQSYKERMRNTEKWNLLHSDQKEALDMIQHKIARILNGNPNYIDSWRDIVGYAQLVVDRLSETPGATDVIVDYVEISEEKPKGKKR